MPAVPRPLLCCNPLTTCSTHLQAPDLALGRRQHRPAFSCCAALRLQLLLQLETGLGAECRASTAGGGSVDPAPSTAPQHPRPAKCRRTAGEPSPSPSRSSSPAAAQRFPPEPALPRPAAAPWRRCPASKRGVGRHVVGSGWVQGMQGVDSTVHAAAHSLIAPKPTPQSQAAPTHPAHLLLAVLLRRRRPAQL